MQKRIIANDIAASNPTLLDHLTDFEVALRDLKSAVWLMLDHRPEGEHAGYLMEQVERHTEELAEVFSALHAAAAALHRRQA